MKDYMQYINEGKLDDWEDLGRYIKDDANIFSDDLADDLRHFYKQKNKKGLKGLLKDLQKEKLKMNSFQRNSAKRIIIMINSI